MLEYLNRRNITIQGHSFVGLKGSVNRMSYSMLRAALMVALMAAPGSPARAQAFPNEAAAAGPNLTIDAGSGRHAISPYVYGINYDQHQIPEMNPSIIRWGGDGTSQYNWQTGNTNAGSDWYFINGNQNNGTNPADFDTFLATNQNAGVQTIGTIPINGWVAKDGGACAFSVKKYGAQQAVDPYNSDCGNGIMQDGMTPITQAKSTNPADADVSEPASFMQDWVIHVVSTYGATANGGVAIWELDNEPVWWSAVHQNIHPLDTGYDEVWQKGLAYAQAVKAADPTAKVAGPITSGWWDLFFSKVDLTSGWSTGPNYVYWGNPTDRMAHGNQDFVAWYLQQFAHYEQRYGQRLLDYFDIHGYMPGTGGDATDAASDAARFDSTRVFWDETFTPPNTSEYILNTPPNPYNNPTAPCVCLIPRMKNWVNSNYPGTKLSITEYNLGAQGDLNGALAETDLLGIFGREGLDVATLWPFLGYPDIPLEAPITYAFRMYRNYDGAKSTFGDTGVSSVSADQSQLSVYAAQRTGDGALTVMVINKTSKDLSSNVALANFTPTGTAKVFRYSAGNLTAIQPQPNQSVATTGFTATFPANSASLIVIPESAAAVAEFNDVPPGATYFGAVNLMFQAGVTTGCIQGSSPLTRSFCPDDSVTRQEMAAFIVRAVTGTTTPGIYNQTPYFSDVPATNPFFPHIQKMMDLGITTGCGIKMFCPADTIPRWEMAIFMIRARLALYGAGFTTAAAPYFTDVPTDVEGNGMPFPFIQRSYEEHITNGCGTNPLVYCPDGLATRGQMASFIMRGLFNETTILGPTAPQVTGVSPKTMPAAVGAKITVTVTGVNTSFQAGDAVTVPSGMLSVSNVTVNSATSITATLTANANVVVGPQALLVTSGGQNLALPLAIKVGTY
jgi:hypothetical protein